MILSKRFIDALSYAAELFIDTPRKGTKIPYLSHLLAVTAIVLEHGGDEDQAIAALLHDAIEDKGVTYESLKERYGERVAQIVSACTDADVRPKPPWKQRKEHYISSVPAKRSDAILVSMADKVHNAQAILADYKEIGDKLWERFAGGKEGTLWYYRSLINAYQTHGNHRLLRELDELVNELERLVHGGT